MPRQISILRRCDASFNDALFEISRFAMCAYNLSITVLVCLSSWICIALNVHLYCAGSGSVYEEVVLLVVHVCVFGIDDMTVCHVLVDQVVVDHVHHVAPVVVTLPVVVVLPVAVLVDHVVVFGLYELVSGS